MSLAPEISGRCDHVIRSDRYVYGIVELQVYPTFPPLEE
jgi:hypothetical protein